MDDSRQSLSGGQNDESVTMYLSFADDTLASGKWQSTASQTSQYLEMDTTVVDEQDILTSEEHIKKNTNCTNMEQELASPFRPFDKSILNKHNALSSTPSKIAPKEEARLLKSVFAIPLDSAGYNKENTQPDVCNEISLFSNNSSADITGSTVKANTFISDTTVEETAAQESISIPQGTPAALEKIVEVSREEPSPILLPLSNAKAEQQNIFDDVHSSVVPIPITSKMPSHFSMPAAKATKTAVVNAVDEVSNLIATSMKLYDESIKPPTPKDISVAKKLPSAPVVPLPRPRRSYLPTVSTENRNFSFKPRMSVVVKTTLNSPARKLSASSGANLLMSRNRRSCLPVSKIADGTKPITSRKSMLYAPTSSTNFVQSASGSGDVPKVKPKQNENVQYTCKNCNATFKMKSLMDMHMRIHDLVDNGPKKWTKVNSKSSSDSIATSGDPHKNRCKYCDKNFALERALHIHLMQNCDKIPPSEKRKLQFTELNHVKKAQLPKVGGSAVVASYRPRQSTLEKVLKTPSEKAEPLSMQPPSIKKVPKKIAHSGVYRTPTKTVPCHICKQSFKSILEYTDHCLTMHSKKMNNSKADAQSAAKD